jgi:hypothetical protein
VAQPTLGHLCGSACGAGASGPRLLPAAQFRPPAPRCHRRGGPSRRRRRPPQGGGWLSSAGGRGGRRAAVRGHGPVERVQFVAAHPRPSARPVGGTKVASAARRTRSPERAMTATQWDRDSPSSSSGWSGSPTVGHVCGWHGAPRWRTQRRRWRGRPAGAVLAEPVAVSSL